MVDKGLDDKQTPTARFDVVLLREGVGKVIRIESVPLVGYRDLDLPLSGSERHAKLLFRISLVPVLDRVVDQFRYGQGQIDYRILRNVPISEPSLDVVVNSSKLVERAGVSDCLLVVGHSNYTLSFCAQWLSI